MTSNVLIVPERNEGQRPLLVIEEGLKSASVDEVLVVDGWSTDDTVTLLSKQLPILEEKYHKRVKLIYSELRNTGKGGAMVTGIKRALADSHKRIIFLDADITSITSKWCDVLIEGIDKYNVAMTRGYFDRSPFDAQITRHVTRPLINLFFPEGRKINQPLGGELCLTAELAHNLLNCGIAPPHTWGIDTFLVINTLVGGYHLAELYLTQKTHKKKSMDKLRGMFIECFDEVVKQVHIHGRDRVVPINKKSLVRVLPPRATEIERVGDDVRAQIYVDLDEQIASFFAFVGQLRDTTKLMSELSLLVEDTELLLELFSPSADFKERSKKLNIEAWVRILDSLVRSYIAQRFNDRYHNLLFAIWNLRTLSFCLNEAQSFDEAERNTKKQALYAFQYAQGLAAQS
ncbi:MAG TPA: glycosyltransferase [Thermoplasmata archaeon]|nr:glycosyltransferase [Thermoplasmata archaeon]